LPGSAALHLSIVDADLEQQAQVEVIRPTKTVKAPKAVKRTNSLVEEGYLLELTSATAGATIYYTTDGSCPCNETTRKLYTGPIALNQEGDIEIRAIAVREGMEDSSVSTFHYTVTKGFNLQMTEGWNWLSIPLASMVKLSQVTGSDGDVTRVLSQTQEVIYDPVCGWVGNLSGLIGGQSYKVLTTNTRNVKLTEGTLFKNMTLQLQAGWNWMGYTCMFDAPLSHALKGMEAEENDVIYSQGRFATYSDGQWTGTLDSFAPGQGYMYKSMSQKPLVYNAEPAPQETRKATTKLTVTEQEMPWHVDVTRHPDQMAVIGMLYSHGKRVEAHTVGAFCGLECRGISTTINGKVYLTISGRSGETITLRTLEDDGRQLSIDEQLVLDGDLHGSPSNPMTLTITDEAVVGINNTTAGILSADDEPHYNVGGRRVATETVRKGEVHVKRGQSIFRK
jgi:hypothetical protein